MVASTGQQLPPHWQEPPDWQPHEHPDPQPQAPSTGSEGLSPECSAVVGGVGKSAMSASSASRRLSPARLATH
ncbi:hypothetical protein [Streptomyces sp. SS8]